MLEQGIGAYIAVVVFAVWTARRHLRSVWRAIWLRTTAMRNGVEGAFSAAELGEFMVGGFWALLAMITRDPQYTFWP